MILKGEIKKMAFNNLTNIIAALTLGFNLSCGGDTMIEEASPVPERKIYACDSGMRMAINTCCSNHFSEYEDLCSWNPYPGNTVSLRDIARGDMTLRCHKLYAQEGSAISYETRSTTKFFRCAEYVCAGLNTDPAEPFMREAQAANCEPQSLRGCNFFLSPGAAWCGQ